MEGEVIVKGEVAVVNYFYVSYLSVAGFPFVVFEDYLVGGVFHVVPVVGCKVVCPIHFDVELTRLNDVAA